MSRGERRTARGRTTVRRTVWFSVLDTPTPPRRPVLEVTLSWRADDPYAVAVTFPGLDQRWVFSRCLLAAGLTGPAGLGDVSILPDLTDPTRRELILSSPSGRIGFLLEVHAIEEFLGATWAIVAAGQEPGWIRFEPRRCHLDGESGSGIAA